jgi:hypothetical protein
MNSDTPKGGIVTPEAPPPNHGAQRADYTSKPEAPYPPYPYPSAQPPYPSRRRHVRASAGARSGSPG